MFICERLRAGTSQKVTLYIFGLKKSRHVHFFMLSFYLMENKIEIFKAGTHIDMSGARVTIDAADLARTVAEYDKTASEAPIVIGHPETDAPAYGWVSGLSVDDSGVLMANLDQVAPEFAEVVKAGRYKHVSASFYAPQSPGNPKPGAWYLRHVGFLGATPPAVKGLKPVAFSNDSQFVFSFAADTAKNETKGNNFMNEEEIKRKEAELAKKEADIEAKAAEFAESAKAAESERLKAKEDELKAREDALEAKAAETRKLENVAFVEGLIKDGKILPRDKENVVTLMSLVSDTTPVNFAENGESKQMSAIEAHKKFLEALPVRVDFSEKSKDDKVPSSDHGDGDTAEKMAERIVSHSMKKGK